MQRVYRVVNDVCVVVGASVVGLVILVGLLMGGEALANRVAPEWMAARRASLPLPPASVSVPCGGFGEEEGK